MVTPAVCSKINCPAMVNPKVPRARAAGETDDSNAIQEAINAPGDVYFPAGTYLINHRITMQNGAKQLRCAPDAVIKNTDPNSNHLFRILRYDQRIANISFIGCSFQGPNTVPPQFAIGTSQWNIPIFVEGMIDDVLIAGNTFNQFFGQSMVQTYAHDAASSGKRAVIAYNTFSNCGYYGAVFTSHANGYIGFNTSIDCSSGVENDDATQATGGNIIEFNTHTVVNGHGAARGVGWTSTDAIMLTGGAAGQSDYTGNVVRYNTISGSIPGKPSVLYTDSDIAKPAQYGNTNSCTSTNGCLCRTVCDANGPGAAAGSITVLTNNVAVSGLSAPLNGMKFFAITMPAGKLMLRITTSGGTGNVDVYAKLGALPTTTSFDARGASGTNGETVNIMVPKAGTYYLLLFAKAAYSGVTLKAAY